MVNFQLSYRHECLLIFIGIGVLLLCIVQPQPSPLISVLRLLLTILFLLILPGYVLQSALFPAKEALDGLERFALSLGVSLAVIPPLALLLDVLPGIGIRMETVLIAELLVIGIGLFAADYRRNQLPAAQRYRVEIKVEAGDWWRRRSVFQRVSYSIFGALVLLAIAAALMIATIPGSAEHLTEFYLLDADQLIETLPRRVVAGENITITVGITSHETTAQAYRLEILSDDSMLDQETLTLSAAPDETVERPVQFRLMEPGENQQVTFNLYREGDETAYRTLDLWFDVVSPPDS